MTKKPGAIELYECLLNQNQSISSSCVQFCFKVFLAMALLLLSIYVYFAQQKFNSFLTVTRKQKIFLILFIDMIFYLAYQLSIKDDALYFPILYFQFMFICYIIYYFGRKSIMLATFNLAYIQREINSTIQLKLSKLMCAGLIFFFTVVFILNYIDYFIQQNNYHLCQASFFNIITTVSFLLQGLFLLQIRQFTRQINKNIKNLENANDETEKIVKEIKKRLSQIWILVIINIIGSFVSFAQNIYFVLMNEILRNQPERYTCYYVKIEDDPALTNIINSSLELSEKILSFFLPYFAALIIFWPKKSINQVSDAALDNTDIIVETYIIHTPELSDQSSNKE